MKSLALAILITAALGPALGAAAPRESLDAYSGIMQNNIFDPNRSGFRPASPSGTATDIPAAPPVTVALVGVAVLDGETTAVFASATAELAGNRRPGERLADLTIAGIDLAGVTVKTADETLRLAIGSALIRQTDTAWQVTDTPAMPANRTAAAAPAGSAATAPAAAAESTAPADASATSGDSPEDLARRMRERRQKELNP